MLPWSWISKHYWEQGKKGGAARKWFLRFQKLAQVPRCFPSGLKWRHLRAEWKYSHLLCHPFRTCQFIKEISIICFPSTSLCPLVDEGINTWIMTKLWSWSWWKSTMQHLYGKNRVKYHFNLRGQLTSV